VPAAVGPVNGQRKYHRLRQYAPAGARGLSAGHSKRFAVCVAPPRMGDNPHDSLRGTGVAHW
jgi:hypothetical protein